MLAVAVVALDSTLAYVSPLSGMIGTTRFQRLSCVKPCRIAPHKTAITATIAEKVTNSHFDYNVFL